MEQIIRTVFDAFTEIDADLVAFVDRNGVEIPEEQLDDDLKVLSVSDAVGGVAKVVVDYVVV